MKPPGAIEGISGWKGWIWGILMTGIRLFSKFMASIGCEMVERFG